MIGVAEPGDPHLPELGADLDLRTDLPRYRVWKDGMLLEEPTDITPWWRDDLVAFVIGCSFSFEEALLADGIPLKHIERGSNVPMWRTSIPTEAAGPFHGPLVVSMRPLRPADAIRAIQITSRFPSVHGAPVHIGKPELIGIADLAQTRLRRCRAGRGRRAAGVLGLRGDAAIGHRGGPPAVRDHARAGRDARHRSQEQPPRDPLVSHGRTG